MLKGTTMITLKAALIAASTVGTLSVGGGVTYAMTSSSEPAVPAAASDRAAAAAREATSAAPGAAPTCVPVPGGGSTTEQLRQKGLPKADLPTGKAGEAVEGAKEKTEQLRQKGLPKADLPTGAAGEAVEGAKKKAEELRKKGLPEADLPTCPPTAKDAPTDTTSAAPNARVPAQPPAVPELPAAPELNCDELDPAVRVGGPAEKTLMLAKGLKHATTSHGAQDLGGEKVCAVTQKWTGKAGRWLTVRRVQTPSGVSEQELREALKLPAGGTPVTVDGGAAWQVPGGHGVLVYDENGYSLYVQGSPVLGGVKDVATALRKTR